LRVSFVIPHRKNLAILQAAVRSIRQQHTPAGWALEVIVVDNASAEGAAAWAEAAGCQVVALAENQGFGKAVNRGIRASAGEWVVVMNDDVELESDWLLQIESAIKRTPSPWFVCGKSLQFAARALIDGAGDAISKGGTSLRLGNGRADGDTFNQGRATFFPSATATAFRRTFFEQAGVFDETFFAYLEDVDLGLRAALAGLAGVYAPEARSYHHGSATGQAWSADMVRWISGHQLLLLAKFFPARLLLRNAWNILVAQALWAGLALFRGQSLAWIRGLALGLRGARRARLSGETLRSEPQRLAVVLAASEREIRSFQQSTGFDRYWAWYFRLTQLPWRKTG
jgi:GT2 family glycosyltransferase